jgi:hypothetical protein
MSTRRQSCNFMGRRIDSFGDDVWLFALISERVPGGAQAVIEQDGRLWLDRPKFQHGSQEWRDLFDLVKDHAAGKVEFK